MQNDRDAHDALAARQGAPVEDASAPDATAQGPVAKAGDAALKAASAAASGIADAARAAAGAASGAAEKADAGRRRVADALARLGADLVQSADDLADARPLAGAALKRGAAGVGAVSAYIASRRLDDLVRDAGDLARASRSAYLGASLVAGFILARASKAAATKPDNAAQDGSSGDGQ